MTGGVELLQSEPSFEASPESCNRQAKIDETLSRLREEYEFVSHLTPETHRNIVDAGFNRASLPAAFVLTQLAIELKPITVRGLMYRGQVAGLFPTTSQEFYD